jgi:ABC-type nickel/cobalt efflux system permease component RcnA
MSTGTTPDLRPIEPAAPAARKRGRILTWLAASAGALSGGVGVLIACAACCVPVLVGVGFLTSAAAAGLQNVFLGVAAVLLLAAGALLLVRRHRAQRAGASGCGGDCAC